MAKAPKKKSAKESSNIFHNIMAASVNGNPESKKKDKREHYALPIEQMGFPIRLQTVLKQNDINTLKQLVSYDAFELMHFKNMGIKSISLIELAIEKHGLRLGDFAK
jgi:DNA-directed RNA polymerase alpha subunit